LQIEDETAIAVEKNLVYPSCYKLFFEEVVIITTKKDGKLPVPPLLPHQASFA
jgi:hypothetical protein